jgi:hypothetical protein
MNGAEFENGLPRTLINTRMPLNAAQTLYGNFAYAVLHEVRQTDPLAPDHVLTFGDNWFQLTVSKSGPTDEIAKIFADVGFNMFGDMWPIMERAQTDDIYQLMAQIQLGIRAGTLNREALAKMAVIDLTKALPALKREDLEQPTETPWGMNGRLRIANTLIYHITSGYARQNVVSLMGSPADNISSTAFLRGPKKWQ